MAGKCAISGKLTMLEENRFENVLESLRVRRGWTQKDAAAHIEEAGEGLNLRTYIKVETGQLPPSEKHLKLIVAGFKLNPADIDALYHAAHHTPPRIHTLPFNRNLLFTGRDDQLKDIRQFLKDNYRVALSGLAGIGKTQLALEYAHRCYKDMVYQAVFWVNAADEAVLQGDYVTLAETLDLPEKNAQELKKIVYAVMMWLERHTNWLLIMDNADDLQLARSFFPKVNEDEVNPGHILLTTRTQIVGNVAPKIDIDRMEPEEGRIFLLRRSGVLQGKATLDTVATDTRHAASQIVELLNGHPLALDQAGAYIEDGGSFTEYINRYHMKLGELLSERGSLDEENKGKYSEYPDTVAVTFGLCFVKAFKRYPLAIGVLRACAFLQPDTIPDELLRPDERYSELDNTALKKSVKTLLRYSLLKHNAHEQTFSMHRLVQAVLIDTMSSDRQKEIRAAVVLGLDSDFPEGKFEHWKRCERLLPHVLVCATWTEDELVPTVGAAGLFTKAGGYLRERCQYSEAEPLLVRAISLWELLLGKGCPESAKSMHHLAILYEAQGKYEWALSLYEQVYSIYTQHKGFDHPDTASILNDLANFYREGEYFEESERLHLAALGIRVEHLGFNHPDTALSLVNLAAVYHDQRMFDKAEALMKRALAIRETQLGVEHPDTSSSLYNLATLYHNQGKYEQAEALYQRALAICKKHLGADHPDTASTLRNLAMLYHDQRKFDQAEALYQRALSILEQRLGAKHPNTQATRLGYTKLLQNLGRDAEAAALAAIDEPPV